MSYGSVTFLARALGSEKNFSIDLEEDGKRVVITSVHPIWGDSQMSYSRRDACLLAKRINQALDWRPSDD